MVLLPQGHDGPIDALRGVGDTQFRHAGAHAAAQFRGAEDLSGGPVEGFAGGILLQNDPCAAVCS